MNRWQLWFSLPLFTIVILGALRSIFDPKWPFLQKTDDAKHAYLVLAVTATALFAWVYFGDRLEFKSIEIAGVTAEVRALHQQVQTFSEQMEAFLKGKKIEVLNKKNWNQKVRTVGRNKYGTFTLDVTLDQEPIPGTIEVLEGVLMMPEQDYQIDGKELRFPSNYGVPTEGVQIAIKYYPRVISAANAPRSKQ